MTLSALGSLVAILLLFLVPGYVLWAAFGPARKDEAPGPQGGETLFLIVLSGALLTSWLGLLLAETGYFSLLNLILSLAAICVLVLAARFKRWPFVISLPRFKLDPASLVAIALILVAVWLFFRPYEYVLGIRDHGIYVNTGASIARTGSIILTDRVLAQAPAESRSLLVFSTEVKPFTHGYPGPWSEGQRLIGYTLRDLEAGLIVPHGFHLYPVWLAIFYSIGGLTFALWATPCLALLGTMGLYLTVNRLLGRTVGLLSLGLVIINIGQLWYARCPSAEILVQYLFWAGLLAFALTPDRYLAFLAGCCFGHIHLAKLDIVFLPPALALFFACLWLRGRFRPRHKFFIAAYLLLGVHAVLHGALISTIYFLDQVVRVFLPRPLAEAVAHAIQGYTYPADIFGRLAGFIFGGLLLWGLMVVGFVLLKKPLARALQAVSGYGRLLYPLFVGAVVFCGLYAYFVRPYTSSSLGRDAMLQVGWYVTPIGVFLGLAGFLQAGGERAGQGRSLALLLIFSASGLLLVTGPGTTPDHFWAIRRFVPVVIPSFIIFSACALCRLKPGAWLEWILPVCLGAALAVGYLQTDRGFIRFTEYQGTIEWVERFASNFPQNSILLFERSSAANALATPLWAIFDRAAFVVTGYDARLVEAVRAWQAEGRDVYWLSSQGKPAPSWGDYAADYLSTSVFSTAMAELSPDHLPRQKWEYMAVFDAYKIVPSQGSSGVKSVFTVEVGEQGDEDYLREGFYAAESALGGMTMRWTKSEAVIALPLEGEPVSIILRAAGGRPPGVPQARVTVYLDDYPLGELALEMAFKEYSLSIPEGTVPAKAVRLRLESSTWNPAQVGYGYARDLGIQLDWVKVVTVER